MKLPFLTHELFRANFILLLAVFRGCLAYQGCRRYDVFWSLHRATALACAVIIALLPYRLFNWRQFWSVGPQPPSQRIGPYIGSWESELTADDVQSMYSDRSTERGRSDGFSAAVARINAQFGLPPLTPPYAPEAYGSQYREIRSVHRLRQMAIERMEAHPRAELGMLYHVAGNYATSRRIRGRFHLSFESSLKPFRLLCGLQDFWAASCCWFGVVRN